MSEAVTKELPDNWAWSTLGDVCEKPQYGWTTKASQDGDLHLLRTTDITSGQINWATVPYCVEEPEDKDKYLIKDGDIVVSRAGSVGVSYLISNPEPSVFASYLIRFKPLIDRKYVYYFLKSPAYWNAISEKSAGIALQNVNASKLKEINIPVAPPEQQKRIVAKIEELFSHIDAGIEALKKAKQLLKQYRQSVLKAAVTGELTKEWRDAQGRASVAEGRTPGATEAKYETAKELLERILKERRKKWEHEQLRQFTAKGLPALQRQAGLPAPKKNRWWVYVLLCDDNSFYIGVTEDMPRRWNEHVSGNGAEHTKKHKPISIIHHEEFKSQEDAYNREKELKTGFGRKWLKRGYEKGTLRQAGKMPKDDKWKEKYQEAEDYISAVYSGLSEEWTISSLSALSTRITYGLTVRPKYVENGVPVISAKEIRKEKIDLTIAKTIDPAEFEKLREKCKIFYRDVLFSKTGTIGRVAVVNDDIKLASSQNIAVITPLINSDYLRIVLLASYSQRLAAKNVKTTAIPDLQLGILATFPIPVPSEVEQKKIVEIVEQKFSAIEYLDNELERQLIKSVKTKQSILASAFSGLLDKTEATAV